MEQWQRALNGTWLIEPSGELRASGIETDSRANCTGRVFVALRGERFDGHDFVKQAIGDGAVGGVVGGVVGGAVMVMIDKRGCDAVAAMNIGAAVPVLVVDDTLVALQKLASMYRDELAKRGCQVIAVTGSAGKTTTRRLIHQVLGDADSSGHQSPKSFNNHLGVPLTILGVGPEHEFVVAEVGMNHAGEIAPLAKILRPDVAVLTNVGVAHIGHLGSREAIAQEKSQLFGTVAEGGCVVVPTDESLVDAYLPGDRAAHRFAATSVTLGDDGVRFGVNDTGDFFVPMLGRHNAANAAAAVTVARVLGVDDEKIAQRLCGAVGESMRMQIEQRAGVTILNDAYNANPDAMKAALDVLAEYPTGDGGGGGGEGGGRIAVLGDMGELGEHGPDLHREVGRYLAGRSDAIGHVMLIGRMSLYVAEALLREWPGERVDTYASWSDDLPTKLAAKARPGDVVLIKGSRSMQLERLLKGWDG